MAGNQPNLPPQAAMMQLLNGMTISRCIGLAAELAIADQLVDEPRTAAALAAPASVDAGALHRVLRTLAGVGIFAELSDGRFANTPLSELMRSDAPGSVRNIARWITHPLHWRSVGDLDYSVRTGKPSVVKDHPGKMPFQILSEDKGAQAVFNDAMMGLSLADAAVITGAYDFSRFRKIVDVGGGYGSLATMIARAVPSASVVVYDLPHVVEGARRHLDGAGLQRIETVGGSFLQEVPGPADLCVLRYILHLGDDAGATRILENCRKALSPGGTVLVCEMMITPGPESMPARIMDIEMLIGPGGRERSESEFAGVFAAAGFALQRVIPTPMPIRLFEAVLKP
jgi:SAM-dependent methyltransferase